MVGGEMLEVNDVLTVGSLFAGIGGIDLGLERTGHFRTVWFCERDEFCQRVLAKHWPGVPCYDDVADIGADVSPVDVLTAGFPCQPVSLAGQRLAQDDERWLWPHVDRLIRLLRPSVVMLENVPGLLSAGFDDVIGDLAACGYDAEWDCIPAAAVGAHHRRDRVFVVAYPAGTGLQGHGRPFRDGEDRHAAKDGAGSPDRARHVADSSRVRRQGPRQLVHASNPPPCCQGQAVESLNGGFGGEWEPEPNVGRVANGVPNRVDRLRSLGNAVVPQVAQHVGQSIVAAWGLR